MRTLIFTALILIASLGMAQNQPLITGVETFGSWDSTAAGELPQYWDGFNRQVIVNGMYIGDIINIEKDSADPQDSDYSVKLTSRSVFGGAAAPGLLTTAIMNIDFNTHITEFTGGIPYSQKPTQLKGWYKYTPATNDTALISVWFNQDTNKIGDGILKIHNQASIWTAFTVNLNYQIGSSPDTMNILFSTTTLRNNLPIGSTLEIDHIWFEGGTLGANEKQKQMEDFKIYPNPASSMVNIENPNQNAEYSVNIYNSMGQHINGYQYTNSNNTLDVSNFSQGIYYIEILMNEHRKMQKLVVE